MKNLMAVFGLALGTLLLGNSVVDYLNLHTPATEVSSRGPIDAATVERLVDGDTLVAGGRTIRLIGVDTPETKDPRKPVQCFGRAAAAKLAELVPPGEAVRVEVGVEPVDRYGRTLAYLYRARDGLWVNMALVEQGYARVATYPPNDAHAGEYLAAERAAREAGRGLWGQCR